MVLASELRTRAPRAPEKVSWESAQGAAGSGCRSPRPPEPRGAFGPAREPSTARSEMHQKRVGHPATTAIGSLPEGFKKNGIGSTLPHTTIRTPTGDRFILYPHPPPPRPREARAAFVGAEPPTAEPELPRTLYVEGASRVGCMYRFEDAIFKTGRTVGTLGSSDLHRAGRGAREGRPHVWSCVSITLPHTNLVVDVLQGFLARGPPDLHLPARFNRWLPAGAPALPGVRRLRVRAQVGDVPLLSHHLPRAPAHRQRVEVDGLVLGGPFHRAEHATEFLPGLGAA